MPTRAPRGRWRLIRGITSGVVATKLYHEVTARYLSWKVRQLCEKWESLPTLDQVVDIALASRTFTPVQKRTEILRLLQLLQGRAPRYVCEIGGRLGGTLALLTRVSASDARILSIDLDYGPGQIEAYATFARANQTVTCLAADSHASQTVERVSDWLSGHELDFLLIDGDHSLDGVSKDFTLYSSFVRSGGIIAFHDIVPDYSTRYGLRTGSYVGGVPLFWNEIRVRGFRTNEFVEDPNQDGFGIGVLYWDIRNLT